MKNVERSIYIVVIVILVGVLSCGITYIVMQNKSSKEIKENNSKKEPTNKDEENTTIPIDEEKITLSDKELEEYISYVPYRAEISREDSKYNAYLNNLKVEDFNDIILTEYALNQAELEYLNDFVEEEYYIKISATKVKNILRKAYNKTIENFQTGKNIDNQEYYQINCLGFIYKNNNFYGREGCGKGEQKISFIDKYELENHDLIIYEYAGVLDDLIGEFKNIKNNNTITFIDSEDYDKMINDARNYIKENKTKFTKYKHTFKKSETGYYWYSTEAT